jgi:hypothetical protein
MQDFFTKNNVYKKLEKWRKDGKPIDQFDPIWMGLLMLATPTKTFGWEGITKTMKAVR